MFAVCLFGFCADLHRVNFNWFNVILYCNCIPHDPSCDTLLQVYPHDPSWNEGLILVSMDFYPYVRVCCLVLSTVFFVLDNALAYVK